MDGGFRLLALLRQAAYASPFRADILISISCAVLSSPGHSSHDQDVTNLKCRYKERVAHLRLTVALLQVVYKKKL
jgi:hypothetical protein